MCFGFMVNKYLIASFSIHIFNNEEKHQMFSGKDQPEFPLVKCNKIGGTHPPIRQQPFH